jgi:hypothetical protein
MAKVTSLQFFPSNEVGENDIVIHTYKPIREHQLKTKTCLCVYVIYFL